MAGKKGSSRRGAARKKRVKPVWLGLAAVVVILLLGAGVKYFGGAGSPSAPPPPQTADGRLVVMEFFDFG